MSKARPLSKLKIEADKLLQMVYRSRLSHCAICMRPKDTMHHYVPKSVSSNLRYDERNLVPICTKCHCRIHSSPDPEPGNSLRDYLGESRYAYLKTAKHIEKKWTREELLQLISDYRARLVN